MLARREEDVLCGFLERKSRSKNPLAGKTTDICSSTRQYQFKAYHELPGNFLSSLDDNKRKKIQQERVFAGFCQIYGVIGMTFATFLEDMHQSNQNHLSGDHKMDLFSRMFGPPMPALTAQELNDRLKSNKRPLVIDVREPEEYQEGHIVWAKLIPLGDLNRHMKDLPRDQEIVCVCASGSRSSSATQQLISAGCKAINMNGGMYGWQRAGLPVKKGDAA